MELEQKIELNKQIRKYTGSNTFVLSLQKQLKTNKYLSKVEYKGKEVKILSDKQYEAAISSLSYKQMLQSQLLYYLVKHQLICNIYT